jgi:hypothetical protein
VAKSSKPIQPIFPSLSFPFSLLLLLPLYFLLLPLLLPLLPSLLLLVSVGRSGSNHFNTFQ